LDELAAYYIWTSHGPILSEGVFLETAKARYNEWSKPVSRNRFLHSVPTAGAVKPFQALSHG